MPSKPTTAFAPSLASQRDRRYLDTFTDQHKSARFQNGRPWWGDREFAANQGERDGFCGGDVNPGDHNDPNGSVWNAPWFPEFKFFEFNYVRSKITIRYDKVIAHDKAAQDRYFADAAKLSAANGWGAVDYGRQPSYQVTSILGDAPRSPKIAQAAQAGDRWLLGDTDEVNEELARLLGLSRQGFAQPQAVRESLVQPGEVQAMTAAQIQQLVADAVAASAKKKRKGATPEQMAAMRAKKAETPAA